MNRKYLGVIVCVGAICVGVGGLFSGVEGGSAAPAIALILFGVISRLGYALNREGK